MRVNSSLVLLLALAGGSAAAQPAPIVLEHHGRLLDAGDNPVTQNALPVTFRLFDLDVPSVAEHQIWEAVCTVAVVKGFYAVGLGSPGCAGDGLDGADFPADAVRYLEVMVDGARLLPRLRVGVVPVAALANDATRLGGKPATDYVTKTELSSAVAGLSIDAAAITSGVLPGARLSGAYGEAVSFTNAGNRWVGDATGLSPASATAAGVLTPADYARFDGKLAKVATQGQVQGDGTTADPVRLSASVPVLTNGKLAGDVFPDDVARLSNGRLPESALPANVPLLVGGKLPDAALPSAVQLTDGKLAIAGTVKSSSGGFEFPDGTVQLTASTGALTRRVITSATTASVNGWYLVNASSNTTVTLPATCAVGELVKVTGMSSGGWSIALGSNQQFIGIDGGPGTSTIVSSSPRDTIELLCVVANSRWQPVFGTQPRFYSPGCNTSPQIFAYTGAMQSLPVGNCTTASFKIWGAGGGGSKGPGGGGGYTSATISVVSGETLELLVGGGGVVATGQQGAGGGGRSAVRRAGTDVVTAGGGGGGGGYNASYVGGAGGGPSGTSGAGANIGSGATQSAGGGSATNNGGTGGVQYQGGLGGDGTSTTASGGGPAGGFGGGGAGGSGTSCYGGGGGGGGWFGGGGGAGDGCGGGSGGGGGGSGFAPSGGTTLPGSGATPGNASDSQRNSAGNGGSANTSGASGLIVVTLG